MGARGDEGGGGRRQVDKQCSPHRYFKLYSPMCLWTSFSLLSGVSEVSRKNKKGGVIIPDDNIT